MRAVVGLLLITCLAGCGVYVADRATVDLCKTLTPERAKQLIGPHATLDTHSQEECSYVAADFAVTAETQMDPSGEVFRADKMLGRPETVPGVGAGAFWQFGALTVHWQDVTLRIRIINDKSPDKVASLEQTRQLAWDVLPAVCDPRYPCDTSTIR